MHDLRHYGWRVALFNARFALAWRVAKFLIGKPIRLAVKD